MQINALKTFALAQLKDGIKVGIVAVYAAVGEQTPYMQVGIILLAVIDSAQQLFVLEENSVFDIFCDQGQVLIDDAA